MSVFVTWSTCGTTTSDDCVATAHPYKTRSGFPLVGERRWLAFSSNLAILSSQAQRDLLIANDVGAVFLTTGKEHSHDVLRLILDKWDWLQSIDTHEQRPFAYLLTMRGRATLDPRVLAGRNARATASGSPQR